MLSNIHMIMVCVCVCMSQACVATGHACNIHPALLSDDATWHGHHDLIAHWCVSALHPPHLQGPPKRRPALAATLLLMRAWHGGHSTPHEGVAWWPPATANIVMRMTCQQPCHGGYAMCVRICARLYESQAWHAACDEGATASCQQTPDLN